MRMSKVYRERIKMNCDLFKTLLTIDENFIRILVDRCIISQRQKQRLSTIEHNENKVFYLLRVFISKPDSIYEKIRNALDETNNKYLAEILKI